MVWRGMLKSVVKIIGNLLYCRYEQDSKPGEREEKMVRVATRNVLVRIYSQRKQKEVAGVLEKKQHRCLYSPGVMGNGGI